MTRTARRGARAVEPYLRLLSEQDATGSTVASILARLPAAMSNLVMIAAVVSATGSFAVAGWAAAAFVAGIAVSGPVRGRVVDVRGASLVLVVTGVLTALAWVALYLALAQSWALWSAFLSCFAAGATYPPITPVMRTMWARAVAEPALKVAATSLESVIVEVSYVVGPAIAAGSLATVGRVPSVLVVAVMYGVGCTWLAMTPPVRGLVGQPTAAQDLVGPLREKSVRRMLAVGLFGGAGISAVEVAILATTEAQGRASIGGLVIGSLSVGCIVGGLAYGAWSRQQRTLGRLRLLLVLVGLGFGASVLTHDLAVMFAVVVLAGSVFAPMTSELYAAFERVSPPQFLTETFSWQASAVQVGTMGTVPLAGSLAEAGLEGGGFLVATGACVVAAALTYAVPVPAVDTEPGAEPGVV